MSLIMWKVIGLISAIVIVACVVLARGLEDIPRSEPNVGSEGE